MLRHITFRAAFIDTLFGDHSQAIGHLICESDYVDPLRWLDREVEKKGLIVVRIESDRQIAQQILLEQFPLEQQQDILKTLAHEKTPWAKATPVL